MTRRLILHIGPPKTGSTVFQRWMIENADALYAAGLAVPTPFTTPSGSAPRLARALMGIDGQDGDGSAKRERAAFKNWCDGIGGRDVLLSAEFLFSLVPWQVSPDTPRMWNFFRREKLVSKTRERTDPNKTAYWAETLQAFCRGSGFESVHVTFMLREFASWHGARHMQKLKTAEGILALPFLAPGLAPIPDIPAACQTFERLGFHVHPLAHQRPSDTKDTLVSRIFSALGGLPDPSEIGASPKALNVSPGASAGIGFAHVVRALAAGRTANPDAVPLQKHRRIAKFAREIAVEKDMPFQPFTPDAARHLTDSYEAQLTALSPWMPDTERAAAMPSRDVLPARSPLSLAELEPDGAEKVLAFLRRVADEIDENHKMVPTETAEALRAVARSDARPHALGPEDLMKLGGLPA